MKLIVLNLPRELSEVDLNKLFRVHGKITAANIVKDTKTGASKGFGFVEMSTDAEGALAIEKLNGRVVEDKKIRVKLSTAE